MIFGAGTYNELLQKNGHFAQLIKQFQSEAEEQEKKESGSRGNGASAPAAKAQSPKASPSKSTKQVDEPETTPNADSGASGAATNSNELNTKDASKEGAKEKTDPNKAKLMTDEDSASGTKNKIHLIYLFIL